MKRFDEIVGYVYNSETYCGKCLKRELKMSGFIDDTLKAQPLEDILDIIAADSKLDRQNEWSFDSQDFPKVIFASDAELMTDFCNRCDKQV
jgi:hypothetical protein